MTMRSFSVIVLFSLIAQAHPSGSFDKLSDKLADTLSMSVGDTFGDWLADRAMMADRATKMQSSHPDDLDNTMHAKPKARPRARSGASHVSVPTPFLKPLLGTSIPARPLQDNPKAAVGTVDLYNLYNPVLSKRELYNPVPSATEAKALSATGPVPIVKVWPQVPEVAVTPEESVVNRMAGQEAGATVAGSPGEGWFSEWVSEEQRDATAEGGERDLDNVPKTQLKAWAFTQSQVLQKSLEALLKDSAEALKLKPESFKYLALAVASLGMVLTALVSLWA